MRWLGLLPFVLPISSAVLAQEPGKPEPGEIALPPLLPKPGLKMEELPPPKPKSDGFAIDVPQGTPPSPPRLPRLGRPQPIDQPVTLGDVILSVEMHYPLLRIVEQEREITGGRLLSALGAFDTNISLTNLNIPDGTYENYRFNLGVSQAFPYSGARLFTQYRGGFGDFAEYNFGQKTADGGELRSGMSLPLFRDREIDRPRANLQQAELNRQAVEPLVERQRLDFHRAAARTFWTWVANGERLRIVKGLADLAEDRDRQINQLLAEKLAAKIDRADNLQNLLGRNSALVEAEQALAQSAIELSLFLRDSAGKPIIPTNDRIPKFPETGIPDLTQIDQAIVFALENRPEPRRLRLQQSVAEVEIRWARNQQQPAVNAIMSGVNDFGLGKPKSGPNRLDRNGLEVGFEFFLPAQLRDARGKEMTALAQVRQIAEQLRFQEDQIRAEVQSTLVALERAYESHKVARERVRYARQVAEGERQLFKDGLSELIRVNIREQAAFEAEILEVAAKLNYFRALADYRAALGVAGP